LFISPQRYLETVRRDLFWLLKTEVTRPAEVLLEDSFALGVSAAKAREGFEDDVAPRLADFPNTSASVLAFGVPAQRGGQGLRSTGLELARAVERAIRLFEPRIDPRTLRVQVAEPSQDAGEESNASTIGFRIEGDVRMKPVPEHLLLQAYFLPALAQWRIEGVAHGS
jgi:predicted component of type VI protein secretion system